MSTRTSSRYFSTLLDDHDIDQRYADLLVDWIDPDIAPIDAGRRRHAVPLAESALSAAEHLHHAHLGAARAAGIRRRELRQDRALRHRAAQRRDGQCLHGERHRARRDPQRSAESARIRDAGPGQPTRERTAIPSSAVYTGGTRSANSRPKVEPRVDEKSSWFRLRTHIRVGTAEFVLYSVLYREADNKVRTVQRSFGSE